MNRLSPQILALSAMVWGLCSCKTPGPEHVWVDLSRVPSSVAGGGAGGVQVPSASVGPEASQIAAQGSRELYLGETAPRVQASLQKLRENRQRAVAELRGNVEAEYLAAVHREFDQRSESLSTVQEGRIEAALKRSFDEFIVHAEKRGPVQWKLAAKAGYPDKSAEATEYERRRNRVFAKNVEQVAELRSQLIEMDLEFERMRLAGQDTLKKLGKEEQDSLAKALTEAERQAKAKADQQVEKLLKDQPIAGTTSFLPNRHQTAAVEGSETKLSPVRQSYPVVPAPQSRPQADKQMLEGQLKAWASSHNYVIVKTRREGADATNEFLAWRRKLLGGP